MSNAIVTAAEHERRDRVRAFDAAVEHRATMRRLAMEMKAAPTINEAERIHIEMHRVADAYEVWLRADTARMQSRRHERVARPSDADAFA